MKAQIIIDFLASYGIALFIIAISLAIIYKISVQNQYLFSSSCVASAGFSCSYYRINSTGILNVTVAQATGGSVLVKGIACSSNINSTGNAPEYGNIYVTNGLSFYPPAYSPGTGVLIESGSKYRFLLNCYSSGGIASSTQLGSTFSGYIWFNYTIPDTGMKVTQIVASAEIKYT